MAATQFFSRFERAGVRPYVFMITVVALLTLAACTSTPQPPNVALQAAELSIANAERAQTTDYPLPELREAREKLAAARAAMRQNDMALAERLAEQSRVYAEIASANAGLFTTKAIEGEMFTSSDTLHQ